MNSDPSQAVIDRIVATCNGDIRGALKALLLVRLSSWRLSSSSSMRRRPRG